MIEFVCTPLAVRIAQQGCHGCHAFSHSPNEFMFRFFFSFRGPRKQFVTNEKLSWGARYVKLDYVV